MNLKQLCPHLSQSELKSLHQKTNLMIDFIFGSCEKNKVHTIGSKGEKKTVGIRPIKPVAIFNKIYGSISMAAKELDMSVGTVSRRCNSSDPKYRNYRFINPPKQK